MTGLDQEMMQKNISVKNLKDSQKNMMSFTVIMAIVIFLFLLLGGLLTALAEALRDGYDEPNVVRDEVGEVVDRRGVAESGVRGLEVDGHGVMDTAADAAGAQSTACATNETFCTPSVTCSGFSASR